MTPIATSRAMTLSRWTATTFLTIGCGLMGIGPAAAETEASGPDVTVIYLLTPQNYGEVGGIRSYAVGTTSCNIGDEPLWWCNDPEDTFCETNQHPVIAQNLYRLKEGRFEQLGMSWLKHGFLSTNSTDTSCGASCQQPPHGNDQLGVGCTDTYGSGLNGSRPLGMRSEVNASTGDFPYPYTAITPGDLTEQRIRVAEADLDPALNPGARFWVEGQYIAADDAEAKNSMNNASYREVIVQSPSFNLALQGATVREQAAIEAWPSVDPAVQRANADVGLSNTERFQIARKVTNSGGGIWHYEYAIHNLNSDRSGQSFTVTFPGATAITAAGFHDVDHHSGEPYVTTDWTIAVDSPAGTISWASEDFATNQNANALRWGTMFTFWFDADRPPTDDLVHTIDLFKPGTPASVDFSFPSSLIFADGFESGDTSAWSITTP